MVKELFATVLFIKSFALLAYMLLFRFFLLFITKKRQSLILVNSKLNLVFNFRILMLPSILQPSSCVESQ